jgi:hypothetical protein
MQRERFNPAQGQVVAPVGLEGVGLKPGKALQKGLKGKMTLQSCQGRSQAVVMPHAKGEVFVIGAAQVQFSISAITMVGSG